MGLNTRLAFSELSETAKEAARNMLFYEKMIAQFISDAKAAGVSIIPESIRFTTESASFSASGIDLPVVLNRSGIGNRYLSAPGDYALFCAYATAKICQIYEDSADARLLSVSVTIDPFDNNDDGRAFAACDIAAGFLERYLKNLAISLSVRLHELFEMEREQMISCSFWDEILESKGPVFFENGNWVVPISVESDQG